MGLGEALRRLLDVEIRFRHGVASPELEKERSMLLSALNRVQIQLGFDCDNDGTPDSIDLFRESSETSCCRLADLPGTQSSERLEVESSRAPEEPSAPKAPKPRIFGKLFAPPEQKK